ncbi:CoA transferase [Nocardia sp. NPDC055053]
MIAAVRLVEVTTAQQLVHAYETGLGLAVSAGADEPDPGDRLAATLPVWALAAGSVTAVGAAANRIRAAHGLATRPSALDPARVGAAFSSERLFRRGGSAPSIFAELSGFFHTADGWVRTHANYPHHRDRLTHALGLSPSADAAQFAARVAAMPAVEVEDLAAAAGAIAVRVRTESEWAGSPMGRAAAAGPLVTVDRRADTVTLPNSAHSNPSTWRPTAEHPLRGIRVLDLTRVLAGPVATRTLALLGADVLRVDPPQLPEIDWQFADTCQGKRSTLLDLRTDLTTFENLLSAADVLVTGYRPGALAAAGVRATRPDLIDASVSAWGTAGAWATRRGFDSIVQATSGISLIEGSPDRPGALPAQALDHGSGYLLAAGILDALLARADDGAGRDVRVSLARTASWLLAGDRAATHPAAAAPDPAATVTHGELVTAAPAFAEYADFRWPAPPYGSAQPFWLELPDQRT